MNLNKKMKKGSDTIIGNKKGGTWYGDIIIGMNIFEEEYTG
jgi:hypothetical protein